MGKLVLPPSSNLLSLLEMERERQRDRGREREGGKGRGGERDSLLLPTMTRAGLGQSLELGAKFRSLILEAEIQSLSYHWCLWGSISAESCSHELDLKPRLSDMTVKLSVLRFPHLQKSSWTKAGFLLILLRFQFAQRKYCSNAFSSVLQLPIQYFSLFRTDFASDIFWSVQTSITKHLKLNRHIFKDPEAKKPGSKEYMVKACSLLTKQYKASFITSGWR